MAASNMAVTPGALATTTPPASQSEIELSSQPVYQTQEKLVSQSPINQTHAEFVVSANGTLTLPNATETIRTTSTKSGIVSMVDGTFAGKEILTSEDGSENATATIYEIIRFNMEAGNGTGVAIALFHTNSTESLAPLDGMILTGRGELLHRRNWLALVVEMAEWNTLGNRLAEVVGSTSHPVHFFLLYNYGIILSSFFW